MSELGSIEEWVRQSLMHDYPLAYFSDELAFARAEDARIATLEAERDLLREALTQLRDDFEQHLETPFGDCSMTQFECDAIATAGAALAGAEEVPA